MISVKGLDVLDFERVEVDVFKTEKSEGILFVSYTVAAWDVC
jgi:hypothetical protein